MEHRHDTSVEGLGSEPEGFPGAKFTGGTNDFAHVGLNGLAQSHTCMDALR